MQSLREQAEAAAAAYNADPNSPFVARVNEGALLKASGVNRKTRRAIAAQRRRKG